MKKSILVYVVLWLVWALWAVFILPLLPADPLIDVLDSVVVKGTIWLAVIPILVRPLHIKSFVSGRFPWLACTIILCAVTALLFTLRLLNGLQNTYPIFDPMMIVFSLSAGVIEELSFRGGFFASMEKKGFWPAALINGIMFVLFHFPRLMVGQWQEIISLRALLILVMGIVFCFMYKKWRNIALNITVHTVWNILSYLFCLT